MSDLAIEPKPAAAATRWIAAAVALGLLLRVAIALVSIGTNDTYILHGNGAAVTATNLAQAYRDDPTLNHPPLPIVWATCAYWLSGGAVYPFGLLWKLPGILADGGSIALVGAIVARRLGSARAGAIASMLVAINPTSLLVVGYHGNSDGVVALFTLLAWWLADRGKPALAGLALAASINTKLGPAPTVIVLLACARSRHDLFKMLTALAIGAIPFLVMHLWTGPAFFKATLGYRPPAYSWLAYIAWYARSLPYVGPIGLFLSNVHFYNVTQSTLLIAMACAALRLRRPGQFDPLTIGAVYWAAWMFWNGGGFQYCEWVVPLFAAVRPRLALAYGIGAGVFLAWAYYAVLQPGFPFHSSFSLFDDEVWHRALGLPLIALLVLLISLLRRPKPSPALA